MNRKLQQQETRLRRIVRVRMKVRGTLERPRLAVRRSLLHMYAQLIDDARGMTLVAVSDRDVSATGLKKTEIATEIGKLLAERAQAKNITTVVFDRRDKKFHGRVKALAEGARSAGLKF